MQANTPDRPIIFTTRLPEIRGNLAASRSSRCTIIVFVFRIASRNVLDCRFTDIPSEFAQAKLSPMLQSDFRHEPAQRRGIVYFDRTVSAANQSLFFESR